MISQEQIPAVIDHMVYDSDGKKIGEARHVFLDDRSGTPEWATVRTGMFGSAETFVPIHEARLVEDHLEVPYAKTKIKEAPHIDADRGRLSEQQEHELYRYYGVDWDASWKQANDPSSGWASPGSGEGSGAGTTGADTGAAAGAGAGAGMGMGMTGRERQSMRGSDTEAAGGMEQTRAGTGSRTGTGAGAGAAQGSRGGEQAQMMTRSEEQMRIGTERHETGRARLRKYVVTEEVQQTVPLRHEEAHVEREPITDDRTGAAIRGSDIGEDEQEIVLHAERAVTDTETVPVERVRLVADELTEDETIRGQVRKERIDAEGVTDDSSMGKRGGTGKSGPGTSGGSGGSGGRSR